VLACPPRLLPALGRPCGAPTALTPARQALPISVLAPASKGTRIAFLKIDVEVSAFHIANSHSRVLFVLGRGGDVYLRQACSCQEID
jgi:hypothetical protein